MLLAIRERCFINNLSLLLLSRIHSFSRCSSFSQIPSFYKPYGVSVCELSAVACKHIASMTIVVPRTIWATTRQETSLDSQILVCARDGRVNAARSRRLRSSHHRYVNTLRERMNNGWSATDRRHPFKRPVNDSTHLLPLPSKLTPPTPESFQLPSTSHPSVAEFDCSSVHCRCLAVSGRDVCLGNVLWFGQCKRMFLDSHLSNISAGAPRWLYLVHLSDEIPVGWR